jgi:hypothetical protein
MPWKSAAQSVLSIGCIWLSTDATLGTSTCTLPIQVSAMTCHSRKYTWTPLADSDGDAAGCTGSSGSNRPSSSGPQALSVWLAEVNYMSHPLPILSDLQSGGGFFAIRY